MPTYTVQVKKVCPSGGHITFNTLRDGTPVREVMLHRNQIMDNEMDIEESLPYLLRFIIKKAKAMTLAQVKAAIESATLEI